MAGINRTTGKATDLITFSRASGGTYLDSDGLLKTASTNIPRIDYDASGNVKGLLIEEARTNLVTYSEDLSQWITGTAVLASTAATSPSGAVDAYSITPSEGNTSFSAYIAGSNTAGTYTSSVWVKDNGRGSCFVSMGTTTRGYLINVDLINGSYISGRSYGGGSLVGYSIDDFGDGWYRVAVTATADSRGVLVGGGDGVSSPDGIYIWGAQLEAGSFPTSYIPTSGATATRAADIASISVDSFGYRQDAGTVVVEAETISTSQANHADLRIKTDTGFVVIDSGSRVGSYAAGSYVVFAPATSVNMKVDSVITGGQPYKSAYTIKENDAALSVDGSSIVADTTTNFSSYPAGVFELGKGANYLNGHIKSISYYPRRLSNAQLVELTA